MQQDSLRDFFKLMRYNLPTLVVLAGFVLVVFVAAGWILSNNGLDQTSPQISSGYSVEVIESSPTPKAADLPLEIVGMYDKIDDTETYEVMPGDSLWQIAEKVLGEGSRYPELVALNQLSDPGLIVVGQELRIRADTQNIGSVKTDVKSNYLESNPINISQEKSVKHEELEQEVTLDTPHKPVLENRDQILTGMTTEQTYEVQPGDCLWDIARDQLGDPYLWVNLYNLNKGNVGLNPDLIFPGQVLILP